MHYYSESRAQITMERAKIMFSKCPFATFLIDPLTHKAALVYFPPDKSDDFGKVANGIFKVDDDFRGQELSEAEKKSYGIPADQKAYRLFLRRLSHEKDHRTRRSEFEEFIEAKRKIGLSPAEEKLAAELVKIISRHLGSART